jgi:serine/threonine-protein kinase
MTDWNEVERLFHLALAKAEEEREAFLRRACGSDQEMLKAVLELVKCHEGTQGFLETPALEVWFDRSEESQRRSNRGDQKNYESSRRLRSRGEISEERMEGRTLGRYRILNKLGQGGMGEVFLAEDVSLERKVAIKLLPASLEQDSLARRRFLREAKMAAALDHPYICHINEVAETDDGKDFIVMEFVEGRTLTKVLAEAPLPIRRVLQISSEVAEGLSKAHNDGIVHRDLKPANIMLTPGGHAKIMDFGLAKRFTTEEGTGSDITSGFTGEGATVGTLAYMSPEQIQARRVDHRSDIFSFGIVIFEMVTQLHPFRRESPMETANAILKEDPPPLVRSGEGIPGNLAAILYKMLQKAPGRRHQDIEEVLTGLSEAREALGATPTELWKKIRVALPWKQILPWAMVPLAGILGFVGAFRVLEQSRAPVGLPGIRSEIRLPEGMRLTHWFRHGLAISRDGQTMAFIADEENQDFHNQHAWRPRESQIYIRRLDQWTAQAVPGTQHAYQPFFSPDGKWLGFTQWDATADTYYLRKIPATGGEITTLCETGMPFGASWGADGIVFAEKVGGLRTISPSGGTPQIITEPNETRGEVNHRLPHHLPDNRGILFVAVNDLNPHWGKTRILVYTESAAEPKLLKDGGSDARYLSSGHLVYAGTGELMAAPFDLERLEITATPVPVLEGISHAIFTGGEWQETGASQFVVSDTGLLAFAPGSAFQESKHSVVWVNRQGQEEPLEIEPKKWVRARVSPDGKLAILAHWYLPGGLWTYDFERKILRRQTFSGPNSITVWGPGPDQFTFGADLDGFLIKRIDSEPNAYERLPSRLDPARTSIPSDWSSDGKWLASVSFPGQADVLVTSEEGKTQSFAATQLREEFPEFSPDGRWVAYAAVESDRYQVYVRPFPGPGTATQISTEAGWAPVWGVNMREIFYRIGGKVMSAEIRIDGDRLTADLPVELFDGDYANSYPIRAYDLAPDGRFLMIKNMNSAGWEAIFKRMYSDHLRIKQNWFEELNRLVPKGG